MIFCEQALESLRGNRAAKENTRFLTGYSLRECKKKSACFARNDSAVDWRQAAIHSGIWTMEEAQ
jgi:hypothetical protein